MFSLLAGCARQPQRLVIKDAPSRILSHKDQTAHLRAAVYDKDGLIVDPLEPIIWTTSDASVLAVDDTGTVKARSSGTATIEARVKSVADKMTARVEIVGAVKLTPASTPPLRLGQTLQLKALVTDDHGNVIPAGTVSWSTGSQAVSVDAGLVTAQALGTTHVYVTAGDKSASISVTVKD
jgi:alpha-amylase